MKDDMDYSRHLKSSNLLFNLFCTLLDYKQPSLGFTVFPVPEEVYLQISGSPQDICMTVYHSYSQQSFPFYTVCAK